MTPSSASGPPIGGGSAKIAAAELAAAYEAESLEVMAHYPIDFGRRECVQLQPDASVWKIETTAGIRCLKCRPFREGKALFALGAQLHLHHAGLPVPGITLTRRGELGVLRGDRFYNVSDWIEGVPPDELNDGHLSLMARTLARFHLASRGFYPPEAAKISNRFWDWPRRYRRVIKHFEKWRDLAAARKDNADRIYLEHVDRFIARGKAALAKLERSAYPDWVARCSYLGMLVHRDFGASNLVLAPDETIHVIDFDTVAHDIPARDLRAFCSSVIKNARRPFPTFARILDGYEEINPLSREEKEVLLIDLEFPHRFHEAARAVYQQGELKGSKVAREAEIEDKKEEAVESYRAERL